MIEYYFFDYLKMIGRSLVTKTVYHKSPHICYGNHKRRCYDWRIYDEYDDSYNSYTLFESKHASLNGNRITIHDVRDAVECCSGINNERMKNECYLQFGVDCKMAEKYYKQIERMERQYQMPDDPIPTRDIQIKKKKKWFMFNWNSE